MGNFHFNASATWNKRSLFDEGTDNTEGIMERAVSLIENKLVGATKQDGDSLALVRAACNFDDFRGATSAAFFNKAGSSELFSLELIDVGDGGGADGLANELNVATIDVLDDHNLLLGEEMEGQVTDSLSEHALLEKENIGTRLNDLLDDAKNVLTFLANDSVHCLVVADDDVRLHITLGGADGELDKTNLGILDAGGTTSQVRGLVVNQAKTIDKFTLVDSSAKLLADLDVLQVTVSGSGLVDDFQDSIDSHWSQKLVVMGDNLGRKGSDGVLNELIAVVEVDRLGHIVDDFHGLVVGNLETIGDGGGVKTLVHEFSGGFEESTSHDDNRSGAIAGLNILSL